MSKKVFYQSEQIYIYPVNSGIGSATPIFTAQSVSTSLNIPRENHSRLGRFAPLQFRRSFQDPTIKLEITMIPSGSEVESMLGLTGPNSAIDGMLDYDDNSFIVHADIFVKHLFDSDSSSVSDGDFVRVALTSGVIENYSFQAAIGQSPTISFGLDFMDIGFDTSTDVAASGAGGFTEGGWAPNWPDGDSSAPVMGPSDMQITFPKGIIGFEDREDEVFFLQSMSLSLPLSRRLLYKIGDRKPFLRILENPIMVTFQGSIMLGGFSPSKKGAAAVTRDSDAMAKLVCGKPLEGDVVIDIKCPFCGDEGADPNCLNIRHTLENPYLDDWRLSNSVGGNTTLDISLSAFVNFNSGDSESNYTITPGNLNIV